LAAASFRLFGRRLSGSDAQVAQLVEHATENRSVGGSIPPLGTTLKSLDLLIGSIEQWSASKAAPIALRTHGGLI
jgi:hypothetical protein